MKKQIFDERGMLAHEVDDGKSEHEPPVRLQRVVLMGNIQQPTSNVQHPMIKKLLYFGCIGATGHYLWEREGCHIANRSALESSTGIKGVTDNFLRSIDGGFTPLISSQGAYRESFVPPFRIVAWNDYTVDSRPGSNSALLGIGYESADEMIGDAINHFPSVMRRQTSPLYLVEPHLNLEAERAFPPLPEIMGQRITRAQVIEGLREIHNTAASLEKARDPSFVRWPDAEAVLDYLEAHGLEPRHGSWEP